MTTPGPLSERQQQVLEADAPLLTHMGIEVVSAQDGRCVLQCSVSDKLINAAGFAFGGVAFSLCDIACAYALGSTENRGVTLNANMTYLKGAVAGDSLTGEASVTSLSRRVASLHAEVKKGDDLIAHGTFTFMLIEGRDARA